MSQPEKFFLPNDVQQQGPTENHQSLLPVEFHGPTVVRADNTQSSGYYAPANPGYQPQAQGQGQLFPPGYVPGVSDLPQNASSGYQPGQEYPQYPQQGYPQQGYPQQGPPPPGDASSQPNVPPVPTDGSSSGSSGGGGGGGFGDTLMWLGDRGASGLATLYAAQRNLPTMKALLPETFKVPTFSELRGLNLETAKAGMQQFGKDEWASLKTISTQDVKTAASTKLGKMYLGSWLGDTILDKTMLSDRTTSLWTVGTDVATPFVAAKLLGERMGPLGLIGTTIAAHVLEKELIEDKKS